MLTCYFIRGTLRGNARSLPAQGQVGPIGPRAHCSGHGCEQGLDEVVKGTPPLGVRDV